QDRNGFDRPRSRPDDLYSRVHRRSGGGNQGGSEQEDRLQIERGFLLKSRSRQWVVEPTSIKKAAEGSLPSVNRVGLKKENRIPSRQSKGIGIPLPLCGIGISESRE